MSAPQRGAAEAPLDVLFTCTLLSPSEAAGLTEAQLRAWKHGADACIRRGVVDSVSCFAQAAGDAGAAQGAREPPALVAAHAGLAMHARFARQHRALLERYNVAAVEVADCVPFDETPLGEALLGETPLSEAPPDELDALRDRFACRALMRIQLVMRALSALEGRSVGRARTWFLGWRVRPAPNDLRRAWLELGSRAHDEGALVVVAPLPGSNGPGKRGIIIDPSRAKQVDAHERAARGPPAPGNRAPPPLLLMSSDEVEAMARAPAATTAEVAGLADLDWALADTITFGRVPFKVGCLPRTRVVVGGAGEGASARPAARVLSQAKVSALAGEHVGWCSAAQKEGVRILALLRAESRVAAP